MMDGTAYLSDPGGSSAIAAGVNWLEAGVLGTTATVIATIAVAAIGLLLLSGRLYLRRSVITIIGCFLLFGATAIASALMQLRSTSISLPTQTASAPSTPIPSDSVPPQTPYDPYAGASVPVDR